MSRVPTEKQYAYLLRLGSGAAIVCGKKRETEMYLRRGWVTADYDGDRLYPYAFIRITPAGLEALAAAVERYGLPDLAPKPMTTRRVCADCGRLPRRAAAH